MFSMFQNATLKLTGWYLLIIMCISLLFSVIVYESATSEVRTRLEQFGHDIPGDYTTTPGDSIITLRKAQSEKASENILIMLFYLNCLVLFAGGIASYLMAKRTLEPLEKLHEAESRFVSDASHELRTPLAAMKTELEVALRDPALEKDAMRELLTSNLEEVDKLTQLSQTLLELSRLNYEKLSYEVLNFSQLARSAVKRYDPGGTRIILKQSGKPIMIEAHRPSIDELFAILIDNAMKYSPPDSRIEIQIGRVNKKASFVISNEGKGISPQELPHIFNRFYRADHSRTRTEKASFGLGLSLAKQIVELHNGELTASSALEAKTTFSVLLPRTNSSRLVGNNTVHTKKGTK